MQTFENSAASSKPMPASHASFYAKSIAHHSDLGRKQIRHIKL